MEELAAAPAAKTHLYFGRDLQKEALARSDVVGAILARTEQRGTSLTLREHIFLLLADPSSSRTARAFGVLMWGTILATSFCFVYETMLWVTDLTGPLPWLYAKFVFQGFYTIETVLRFVTFIPFHQSIRDPFVWLDVVTVLPFWIRLLTVPASLTPANYLDSTIRPMTLRVFEGLAMFRLFKLTRYYEGSHLILRAVLKSITQLLVPLFMLFAMVRRSSLLHQHPSISTFIAPCRTRSRPLTPAHACSRPLTPAHHALSRLVTPLTPSHAFSRLLTPLTPSHAFSPLSHLLTGDDLLGNGVRDRMGLSGGRVHAAMARSGCHDRFHRLQL